MLNLTLPFPMYTAAQAKDISDSLSEIGISVDESTVMQILYGSAGIGFDEDNNFEFDLQKNSHMYEQFLSGSKAITTLLEKVEDCSVKPITKIHIPDDVFGECTPSSWYDICRLFMQVNLRSRRLIRMLELQAPTIIIINEEALLFEAVSVLEKNETKKDDNGRLLRSLYDVGYSLVHGWDEEMERLFISREEEEMERYEEALRVANEEAAELQAEEEMSYYGRA